MGHEVPRLLIEYRELSKLKSTYVDALPGFIHPQTGRIHTSFNQTGAATGRLSSSDPNLQNIPVRTPRDRKSTRLNSSHGYISYAVFCLKKKKTQKSNCKYKLK